MARSTAWKQLERDVGRFFGTMRKVGSGGMGRGDHVRSDAHHPEVFIEAKNKKVYGAVITTLQTVRKEARKTKRVGILLFPGESAETIAVHSDDLPSLGCAAVHSARDPFEFARLCHVHIAPSLRKDFQDFTDAEDLARDEGRTFTVLVCKKPGTRGFVLVFRPRALRVITKWHIAGSNLINTVLAGSLRYDELCAEITSDMRNLIACDEYRIGHVSEGGWLGRYTQRLIDFDHHWQIPKKKRKKTDGKEEKGTTEASTTEAGSGEPDED